VSTAAQNEGQYPKNSMRRSWVVVKLLAGLVPALLCGSAPAAKANVGDGQWHQAKLEFDFTRDSAEEGVLIEI
jgi:hypothetical protein